MSKAFKNVSVELPESVIAIVIAAGGTDPKRGGLPFAMASILGALPFIAAALYKELSADEYAGFVVAMKLYMEQVLEIIDAENPQAALNAAVASQARRVH